MIDEGRSSEQRVMEIVRTMSASYAAAIDHGSLGWQMLSGRLDLESFGQPPAMVLHDRSLGLAAEVPVVLAFWLEENLPDVGTYGQGKWVPIPADASGSIEAAVAWARDSVGSWGAPPAASRRPLRGEVDDENHDGRLSEGWEWGLARPPKLSARIVVPVPAANVRQWLQAVQVGITRPITDRFLAAGWHVHWQPGNEDLQPCSLMVNESRVRQAWGRLSPVKPKEHSWERLANEIGDGRISGGLQVLQSINRWGTSDKHRLGSGSVHAFRADDPEHNVVRVDLAEGLAELAGADVVEQVVRDAVTTLPVHSVSMTFGRGGTPAPWVRVVQAQDGLLELLRDSRLFTRVETLEGVEGRLVWAQATEDRHDFPKAHRHEVTTFLAGQGLLDPLLLEPGA